MHIKGNKIRKIRLLVVDISNIDSRHFKMLKNMLFIKILALKLLSNLAQIIDSN